MTQLYSVCAVFCHVPCSFHIRRCWGCGTVGGACAIGNSGLSSACAVSRSRSTFPFPVYSSPSCTGKAIFLIPQKLRYMWKPATEGSMLLGDLTNRTRCYIAVNMDQKRQSVNICETSAPSRTHCRHAINLLLIHFLMRAILSSSVLNDFSPLSQGFCRCGGKLLI